MSIFITSALLTVLGTFSSNQPSDGGKSIAFSSASLPRSNLSLEAYISNRNRGVIAGASFANLFSSIQRNPVSAVIALGTLLFLWIFHYLRVEALRTQAAVISERQRIAGEIHDGIAQNFAAISIQLDAALKAIDRTQVGPIQNLVVAREVAAASLVEARQSLWNLETDPSAHGSLAESIRARCGIIAAACNAALVVTESGQPWQIESRVENHLSRVTQQAVVNSIEHGHAEEVRVSIDYHHEHLHLEIRDNGDGFADARKERALRGFGMAQMKRRVRACGGELHVDGSNERGVLVSVNVARKKTRRIR